MVRDLIKCNTRQKQLFLVLAGLLLGLVITYGALMKQTVSAIVVRRNVGHEMTALQARVGTLETAYIDEVESITPEDAESLGFVQTSRRIFVSRDGVSRALTLRTSTPQQ